MKAIFNSRGIEENVLISQLPIKDDISSGPENFISQGDGGSIGIRPALA